MTVHLRINNVRHSFINRLYKLLVSRKVAPFCMLAAMCFPLWSYAQPEPRPLAPESIPQYPGGTPQIIEQPPTPAPPTSTLEQVPSQLPTVTFLNGELSIIADNATLRDILEMVRRKTGATIDIPPTANERVFVQLGPGPASQVLSSLLAGSEFNFIVLNGEGNPKTLAKVVLSPKDGTTSTPEEQASSQNAFSVVPNGIGSMVVRRRPGA
jgi:hypothetical protein